MMTEQEDKQSVVNMRQRTLKLEHEGDYWADSEKRQLKKMFDNGEGITKMAKILQRTEPAVMQQIEKMDLYHRKDRPMRRNKTHKKCSCQCKTCDADLEECPRHLSLDERRKNQEDQ